jgi:hypothetical protein
MDSIPGAYPMPPWPDPSPSAPSAWHSSPGPRALPLGHRRVHGVALRTTVRALAFHVTPIVAKTCRIAPDIFVRRIHLVRAFTCWQLPMLLCDRLDPLLPLLSGW